MIDCRGTGEWDSSRGPESGEMGCTVGCSVQEWDGKRVRKTDTG